MKAPIIKTLAGLTAIFILTGMTAAQIGPQTDQQDTERSQENQNPGSNQVPEDTQPSDTGPKNQASEAEKGPKESKKPSLPEQASSTAKDVVNTVFGTVGNIGKALANLFS